MKSRRNLTLTLAVILAAFIAAELLAGGQAPAQGPGGRGGGGAPGAGARAGGAGGGGGAQRGGGGGGQRAGGGRAGGAAAAPAGPTPRMANGKPDLSGHWNNPYTSNMAVRNTIYDPANFDPANRVAMTFARQGEAFPNAPAGGGAGAKTFDLPYTEWGLQAWLKYDPVKNGDYTGTCLPFGMSRSFNAPRGLQITANPESVALMFEQNTWFHWVPLTDFKWPDGLETWTGQSLGHWDGDTLVIETTGFNGYSRLDTTGHPHSKGLKLINKLLRTDSRTIQHTVIVHDPKTYTKDWMNVRQWTLQAADSYIMEYACMENSEGLFNGGITKWKKPDDKDLD